MSEQKNLIEEAIKSGVWQGTYLDAFGYRGNIKLDFNVEKENISGRYELFLSSEDEPQVFTGTVQGVQKGADIKMLLGMGKEERKLEYSAQLLNAGSHATQCICGVANASSRTELGGGVWIAWRYSKSNKN